MSLKKEFCCEKFEANVKSPNTTAPNIRIVKLEPLHIHGDDTSHYVFYITMGYEKFGLRLPMMMISFCPYCGTNLNKFYRTDDYVNEFEGNTFTDV